jgi:hypothetical protein
VLDSLFYLKMLCALALLTSAQLTGAFLSPNINNDSNVYFSISSVFLTVNGILFSIVLYARSGTYWAIPEAYASADGIQTHVSQDILDSSALVGGPFYRMNSWPAWAKNLFLAGTYVLSLLVLTGYSFILFYSTALRHLGTVTSVAVVTTDIIILLVIYSEKSAAPGLEALLLFLSRVLLVSFGVNYWFVGYCFAYILISLYISYQLVHKYHALQNEVASTQRSTADIAKTPEFQALLLNAFFGAMNFYLGYGNSPDVPKQIIDIVGRQYQFWVLGAVSFVATIMCFTFMAGVQFYRREKNKLSEVRRYYAFHGALNQVWIYFAVCYSSILAITLSLSLITTPRDWFLLASGIFLPPAVFFLLLGYGSW